MPSEAYVEGKVWATPQLASPRLRREGPCVSVIIPTLFRDSLPRAIDSVGSSASQVLEIIVVADKSSEMVTERDLALADGATRILFTGGGARGGGTRNFGVQKAQGDWVAFLDDDDEWLPRKLEIQLAASIGDDQVVVSSRLRQCASGWPITGPLPDRTIRLAEPVEDYLFRSRKPSVGRSGVWTSTLLVPTQLAREVLWDSRLERHQDWDWLIRLQKEGNARIVQVSNVLANIWVGSDGSISASGDWRNSLAWGMAYANCWKRRTLVDFICAQPFRYAVQSRSVRGIFTCTRAMMGTRVAPSMGPLAIGMAGVLPRRIMTSLMLKQRGKSQ